MQSIIHATNNQSPLKPEQLLALMTFSKKLEDYFKTFDASKALYYERRDGQYDRLSNLEKTRIIVPANAIRSFAAMFLNEPHRTTRSYKALRDKVGDEIFSEGHRLEPYYASAYAFYRLEWLFRNDARFETGYKPARFLIQLAALLLVDAAELPPMNSRAMEKRANALIDALWNETSDALFLRAIEVVDEISNGNLGRDYIRQKPVTDALLGHFGRNVL